MSESEKKELIENTVKHCAEVLLYTMDLIDIENFIESTLIKKINNKTDYKISIKIKKV